MSNFFISFVRSADYFEVLVSGRMHPSRTGFTTGALSRDGLPLVHKKSLRRGADGFFEHAIGFEAVLYG